MHTNKLNILILILFFCGCTVKDSDDDSVAYISDAQFNFHQDVNLLYVSARVLPESEGKILNNVIVEWYGTKEENAPDSLILKDNGMDGDIIAEDDIYTLKFQNDSTVINNTLGDDSGSVYINILAIYVGQTEKRLLLLRSGILFLE